MKRNSRNYDDEHPEEELAFLHDDDISSDSEEDDDRGLEDIIAPALKKIWKKFFPDDDDDDEEEAEDAEEYEPEDEEEDTEQDNIKKRISSFIDDVKKKSPRSSKPEKNEANFIGTEQYFRLNDFERPANGVREFMRSCYYNTFRLSFPNTVHDFPLPPEFQAFYLHFEFLLNTKDTPENVLVQDIVKSHFTWYEDIRELQNQEKEIVYTAKVPFCPQLIKQDGEKEKTEYLYLEIAFQLKDSSVNKIILRIPQKKKNAVAEAIKDIKNAVRKDTDSKNPSSSPSSAKQFKCKTMLDSVFAESSEPLTLLSGDTKEEYYLRISCYPNFTRLVCPACRKEVRNLGIPGIMLYSNSGRECIETGRELQNYLNLIEKPQTDEEENLIETVRYAYEQNIKHNISLSSQNTRNLIPDEKLQKNYHCIPLGEFSRNHIIPFTCNTARQEREFLQNLNRQLCNVTDDLIQSHPGLYLLKKGTGISGLNFEQFYIHNSMISQLCTNCYTPLPEKFYHYDTVVTIYYFGNSNAGKTTLLCSEYNVLAEYNQKRTEAQPEILNKFNSVRLRRSVGQPYTKKASELKNGHYPPEGTKATEEIPGKLSSLKIQHNEEEIQYMFSAYDMMGAKSVQNWSSLSTFAYVHTLLDDPLSLGKDSFCYMLQDIIPVGENCDQRNYNIQIYLTKTDEYPVFLQEKIQNLNNTWRKWKKEISCGDYLKNTLIYTFSLFWILEAGLKNDFRNRSASEIISPKIQTCIKKLNSEQLRQLDFSESYEKVHSVIVSECLPRQADLNATEILNYLHGIDVIRENYAVFRNMIKKLLESMHQNCEGNLYSNYFLAVYAVSATGFSAVESRIQENTVYKPDFVLEANEMLRHTIYEFDKDTRTIPDIILPIDENNKENTLCKKYLFSKTERSSDDFLNEENETLPQHSLYQHLMNLFHENDALYTQSACTSPELFKERFSNADTEDSLTKLTLWYCRKYLNADASKEKRTS